MPHRRVVNDSNARYTRRLLRARRKWPTGHRTAEKRDELASFHRLTPRGKDHGLNIAGQGRASQQNQPLMSALGLGRVKTLWD